MPVKKGMHDAAPMLDVDCDFIGTQGVDVPAQAAMVRQAVADGYDGIALNIIDPEAFDQVVADALAQGVPVVAFNVDDFATPNARLAAVSQRVYDAGKAVAERALADIPPGACVLLTKHDEGVSALDERQRGQTDVLSAHGIRWMTVITGNKPPREPPSSSKRFASIPKFASCSAPVNPTPKRPAGPSPNILRTQGYWAAGFDLSPKTLELIEAGAYAIHRRPTALRPRILSGRAARPQASLRHRAVGYRRRRRDHRSQQRSTSEADSRPKVIADLRPVVLASDDWTSSVSESSPIPSEASLIIDSHHHFWQYSEREFDWITPDMSVLRADFGPAQLRADCEGTGVQGVVSVQSRRSTDETDALLAFAEQHDFIVGVVGWFDLAAPNIAAELDRYADRAKLVGVREVCQGCAYRDVLCKLRL